MTPASPRSTGKSRTPAPPRSTRSRNSAETTTSSDDPSKSQTPPSPSAQPFEGADLGNVTRWVEHWHRVFRQDVTEGDMRSLVGKEVVCSGRVTLEEGGSPEGYGFQGVIVGYVKERIEDPASGRSARAMHFITEDGLQFAALVGTTWKVIDGEEEQEERQEESGA